MPAFGVTVIILCVFLYLLGYIAFFNPGFFNLPTYLKKLSGLCGFSDELLSELINKYYSADFRSFVNAFRIEEVIRKVNRGEDEEKTLLGIALESGFNSKSTFNQTFKNLKGKSPSDFFYNREK